MIKLGHRFVLAIGLPIALVLATTGCATKKYVARQIAPVKQQVARLDVATNDAQLVRVLQRLSRLHAQFRHPTKVLPPLTG